MLGSPNPITPETEAERAFWRHQNRWLNWNSIPAALLILGAERLFAEDYIFGGILGVGAIVGFVYVDRQIRAVSRTSLSTASQPIQSRSLVVAMVMLILLAWAPVAYDLLIRRYVSKPAQNSAELDQFRTRFWERLNDDQITAIADDVQENAPGANSFAIRYQCTDNCRDTVDGIEKALIKAGWQEADSPVFLGTAEVVERGIIVSPPPEHIDDNGPDALTTALNTHHLHARSKFVGGTVGNPTIIIRIGEKPLPPISQAAKTQPITGGVYVGEGKTPPIGTCKQGMKWRNTVPTFGGNEAWVCACDDSGKNCGWTTCCPLSL